LVLFLRDQIFCDESYQPTIEQQVEIYESAIGLLKVVVHHDEVRVRSLSSGLLKAMNGKNWEVTSMRIFNDLGTILLEDIKLNFVREEQSRRTNLGDESSLA
jgi:hypothetical protein